MANLWLGFVTMGLAEMKYSHLQLLALLLSLKLPQQQNFNKTSQKIKRSLNFMSARVTNNSGDTYPNIA